MRSIRTTLLFSFLALAVLALGGVSWYAYRLTEQNLLDSNARTVELLKAGHKDRCAAARERFDEELVRRAAKIASRSQTISDAKTAATWAMGNVLLSGLQVQGPMPLMRWALAPDMPLSRRHAFVARTMVADEVMPRELDSHEAEYCVLYNEKFSPMQSSPSLAGKSLPEPERAACLDLPLNGSLFEDVDMDGVKLRRVVFRQVAASRSAFFFPSRTGRGGGTGFNRTPRPTSPTTPAAQAPPREPAPQILPNPHVFVQYARDTAHRDREIAQYGEDLKNDLAAVESRTHEALGSLRNRLGLTLLVAFALVICGGMWLGRRSLLPLGRLTDAVSQVSEKDFHLKIDPAQMPEELAPIVTKLQSSLASLEKAFVHEKQAVADISHELRTPIASLVATIQVCLKKQRSADEYRAALATCAEIGDHLHELTQRLLTLARLDAGVDPVQTELLELADVGRACLEMIRPLAEAKGLAVVGKLRPGVLVESDGNKLREIMINLLSNAVQYNRPEGRVELRISERDGRAVIEVADTGIGIPAESRKRLFERFWRADPSRHSDRAHAGLGLAIVKGYVDLLKGTISVESEPGQGTTFRVTLLLAAPAEMEDTVVDEDSAAKYAVR